MYDYLNDVAINQTTGNVVAVGSGYDSEYLSTMSLLGRNGSVILKKSFGSSGGGF